MERLPEISCTPETQLEGADRLKERKLLTRTDVIMITCIIKSQRTL